MSASRSPAVDCASVDISGVFCSDIVLDGCKEANDGDVP